MPGSGDTQGLGAFPFSEEKGKGMGKGLCEGALGGGVLRLGCKVNK